MSMVDLAIAKKSIEQTLPDDPSKWEKGVGTSEEEKTHLDGLKNFYLLRKKWSWFIIFCISFMLLFQPYLLYKVGSGYWDFKDYNGLLVAIIGSNFMQVIGLALIVVKFLFNNQYKK